MAGTGALLLLAAAATFLAVSWSALGLTARIAIVAGATGAALLGGHRLRRRLPAVGAVIFHLGAVLIPVDVLGLALQLDLSAAATWQLVGATAVLGLPLLAVVGRSAALAWGGVAGIPVLATGLGLAAAPTDTGFALLAAPPVLTAAVAVTLAATVLLRARGAAAGSAAVAPAPQPTPSGVPGVTSLRLAGPSLAVGALGGAVLATVAVRAFGADAAPTFVQAGWAATGWPLAALTTGLGLTALTIVLTALRSRLVAAAVPAVVGLGALLAILPAGTSATVVLATPAAALLGLELVALTSVRAGGWLRPLRIGTAIGELAALVLLAPWALILAAAGTAAITVQDAGLALAWATTTALLGLAWATAAARRLLAPPQPITLVANPSAAARGHHLPLLLVGLAVAHAVAAVGAAGAVRTTTTGLLAAGSVGVMVVAWLRSVDLGAVLPWRTVAAGLVADGAAASRPALVGAPARATLAAGATGALGLLGLATMGATATGASHLVASLSIVVVVLAIGGLQHLGSATAPALIRWAGVGLVSWPVVVEVLTGVGGRVDAAQLARYLAVLAVAAVGLLVLAAVSAASPGEADLLRGSVAILGPLLVGATPGLAAWTASLPPLGRDLAVLLGLAPEVWWLASAVGLWLVVEVVRTERPRLLALAAPVLVQAVGSSAAAIGLPASGIGLVLLALALAAGLAAVLAPRRWLVSTVVVAGLAGPVGWALVFDRPLLRAAATVAIGLAIAGGAALRGRVLVAHLGGAVAVIGTWQLLTVAEVTALDLWVAPVALQLWAAGIVARRRGTTSWLTDVPPLLLVVVPAIGERLAGGHGWHSLLAGGLALVAVAGGGLARLGGPLVVGAVVLAVVVVVEVVLVVAGVPTWLWLALGGLSLLAVAALIERTGGNPVAAARDAAGRFQARWR